MSVTTHIRVEDSNLPIGVMATAIKVKVSNRLEGQGLILTDLQEEEDFHHSHLEDSEAQLQPEGTLVKVLQE